MAESENLLPAFARPPLVEVALTLQFDRKRAMRNVDIFRLWQQTEFSTNYPSISEYREVSPFKEVFGVPKPPAFTTDVFRLIDDSDTVLRYNFRHPDLREQIQIQRDRIAFFWQRGERPEDYPRFPYILEKFQRAVETLNDFSKIRDWGPLRPNAISISYTNRVFKGEGWNNADDIEDVVNFWKRPNLGCPPDNIEVESAGVVLRSIVKSDGKPVARMYIGLDCTTAPPENREALELLLTVRGPARSKDLGDVADFLKMGRRQIVTTFDSITTSKMHVYWGKQ